MEREEEKSKTRQNRRPMGVLNKNRTQVTEENELIPCDQQRDRDEVG